MPLNWSTYAIIGFLSLVPFIMAFLLSLNQYLKTKYLHALFMTLVWLCLMVWSLFEALTQLFLSKLFALLDILILIPIGFLVILLLDTVSKESVDAKKIMLVSILSTTTVLTSLDPSQFIVSSYANGDPGMIISGSLEILGALLFLLTGCLFVYYHVKIHISVPDTLKLYSWINLLGAFLLGVIPLFIVGTGFYQLVPGIHTIIMAAGAFTIAFAFMKEPTLAFLLPFKALRLTVIEKSGLPLYTYNWTTMEDLVDESLFSGMLQAVSAFVDESLRKGNIREIKLENALLLLQPSDVFPVVSVLFATKSSQSLRRALNTFTVRFVKEFSQYFSLPINTKLFEPATELVLDCFSFVPEYD